MSIPRRWQLTLDQWFSNFLMLRPFNTSPSVVVALCIAISWLSFCYCYKLQMLWEIEVFQRGQEPQVKNICFRSTLSRKGNLVETRGRYPILKEQEVQHSWGDLGSSMFGVAGRGTTEEKGLKWVPVATNLDPSKLFGSMYCPYPVRTKFKLKAWGCSKL